MRLLFKLLMKLLMFVVMVLVMGSGLKRGARMFTGGSGAAGLLGEDGNPVSAEESDLMSTVFKSALRLVSGTASRSELAGELSDKLYAGRANAEEMSELGIELDKPKKDPSAPSVDGLLGAVKPDGKSPEKPGGPAIASSAKSQSKNAGSGKPAGSGKLGGPGKAGVPGKARGPLAGLDLVSGKSQSALTQLWMRLKPYTVEMSMVPVVFLGMVLVSKVGRRKREEPFVPEFAAVQTPSDSEPYDMEHSVMSLDDEEFVLLVALIYQRQGYRVSLPAGLGGGRSGDFKLARKSERLLVKCEKSSTDQSVPVERVREFHEALIDASATGGMYVASCGFTWDARHFAKTRRIKLINARTLDAQLTASREKPDEDLLTIAPWVSKFMTKVEMTTPHCPVCEVEMEQVKAAGGSTWLCTQRPECSGQRAERKYHKTKRPAVRNADVDVDVKIEMKADVKKADVKKVDVKTVEVKTDAGADALDGSRPVVQRPSFYPASASLPVRKAAPPPFERRAAIGLYADAIGSPWAAARQNGIDSARSQPVTPKATPSVTQGAGTGAHADMVKAPRPAAHEPGLHLPEAQPAIPEAVPSAVQTRWSEAHAEAPSFLRSAFLGRGFVLQDDRPVMPKAAPDSARADGAGARADAATAPQPASRRRGFYLPEDRPVTQNAAPPRREARKPQR